MKAAADRFKENFSKFRLRIPERNLIERSPGIITLNSRVVEFLFGRDSCGEYIEYYAVSRFSGDSHARIYEDGKMLELEALRPYTVTTNRQPDLEKSKQQTRKINERILAELKTAGFFGKIYNISILGIGVDMNPPTEKDLDQALEYALANDKRFAAWLLDKTKFADRHANYLWSRADHPWGTIEYQSAEDAKAGVGPKQYQSETDVLVVFSDENNQRFALHIENKLENGHFTELQPELYKARAEQWIGNEKYMSYTDFETVLIAPQAFYDRNCEDAEKFDRYVPYEQVGNFIADFRRRLTHA